ncbi:hypothetical protein [Actinoplanes awajinensis]|uniref:Uncharacterized protein n=1 Tax=Actinoplanes awajinensis subsp. mycoplanecinus TaxID=135947 RepID=A0A0X3VAP9_9ACTN|nr:hypothetical protein [Actinoplanes awajinensis]KUL41332.1 hypothetical protein ADL15_03490 [Actinoplanes awajinensis subsp. mycoplanecinus]
MAFPRKTAAVLLVALAGLGGARAAVADDGPATPAAEVGLRALGAEDQELWRRQNLLGDLKTWIITRPGIETSGYIESVNNPDAGSTVLLWHGAANYTQQLIKDRARQMGIALTVEQRTFSMADLVRTQDAILDLAGTGPLTDFRINSVGGLTADFDGIIVYGEHRHPRPTADAELGRALTATFGVTVAVQPGGEIIPA